MTDFDYKQRPNTDAFRKGLDGIKWDKDKPAQEEKSLMDTIEELVEGVVLEEDEE